MTLLAGRYQLQSELGSGSYGITHLARDLHKPSQPDCVVKQLRHRAPKILKLFRQEAEMLEKLGKHPQIPALVAYFAEGNQFYIVQDYIDGHNLRREIQPGKKLSEGYVLKLLHEVLTVLSFVHRHRIIHRDIKPENLVRRKTDGQVFLIDFGTVRELSQSEIDDRGRVRTTVAVGTDGYMPIEQEAGKPCRASDLYALGMVAIEALTGMAPKRFGTDPETREKQWRDQATVSEPLATFLAQLTRRHPSQRFKTAQKALAQLQRLMADDNRATDVVAPAYRGNTTLPPVQVPWRLPWRPIALSAGAIIAGLSLWGLGGKVLEHRQLNNAVVATQGDATPLYAEVDETTLPCVHSDCHRNLKLQPEASDAFWRMKDTAAQDGVKLYLLAGFLSLQAQRENLVDLPAPQRQKRLHYSGYHTGYGLALGDKQKPEADWQITFNETAAFRWLQTHGAEFGFELAYPQDNAEGIDEQPWHWRYVGNQESQTIFGGP